MSKFDKNHIGHTFSIVSIDLITSLKSYTILCIAKTCKCVHTYSYMWYIRVEYHVQQHYDFECGKKTIFPP